MIAQVEQFVKKGQFEQALLLLPLMEQVFASDIELRNAVQLLELNLTSKSQDALASIQSLKEALIR